MIREHEQVVSSGIHMLLSRACFSILLHTPQLAESQWKVMTLQLSSTNNDGLNFLWEFWDRFMEFLSESMSIIVGRIIVPYVFATKRLDPRNLVKRNRLPAFRVTLW